MTTVISGTTGIDKVQGGTIVQADLAPNVAGNGPAFTAAVSAGGTYVTSFGAATLSALVYMNGTTDNLSLIQDISVTGAPTITQCRVGCFLARAA